MMERFRPVRFSDQVRAWLRPALEVEGTHDIEDVEQAVETGHMQLWVGPKGAVITEVLNFPRKKVLHFFLAGGEMDQIKDFKASVFAWGKAQGCTEMTLTGRVGWQRALPDWKLKSVNMEFK